MRKKREAREVGMKLGFVIILALYLGVLCMRGYAKDVPMDMIHDRFQQEDLLKGMKKMQEKDLRKYYGIEGQKTNGYFYYKAESPMSEEELMIVRAKNLNEAKKYEEAAERRRESQLKSFEGYGAKQTAQLKKANVGAEGKYVIYMAGEKAEKWKSAFDKAVK